MIRVIVFLAAVLALATGLSWLADRPGNLTINWEGYVVETSVFRAVVLAALVVGLALVTWSLVRHMWTSPAFIGNLMNRRRQKRGLEALSAGMIAVGAGDRSNATRYAILARKTLPNEPMTHLLRAQAAQLAGDKTTSRRIFEGMLASPDTEPLGLRGLFLEAQREGETEAARQFCERALRLNPRLAWAADALFDIQCRTGDWAGALSNLASARKTGLVEKPLADRRRAVLLTAQAVAAEDNDPERALTLALEAHGLAPDLVPAAALAGKMLASRGNTAKAAKVIERTWSRSPHPDLATVFAYARVGDSPRDRLVRVKRLAEQNPYSIESAIAVANAAIDAREFDDARAALTPMVEDRLTQRIATLMARIESEQHGDKGRVREWLARAVNAPRDPVWTADGIVSDDWAPVSPVTGALDAFQWRVPVESVTPRDNDLIARKVEELVALGAPAPTASDVSEAPQGGKAGIRRSEAEDVEDIEPRSDVPTPRDPEDGRSQRPAASPAASKAPSVAAAEPDSAKSAPERHTLATASIRAAEPSGDAGNDLSRDRDTRPASNDSHSGRSSSPATQPIGTAALSSNVAGRPTASAPRDVVSDRPLAAVAQRGDAPARPAPAVVEARQGDPAKTNATSRVDLENAGGRESAAPKVSPSDKPASPVADVSAAPIEAQPPPGERGPKPVQHQAQEAGKAASGAAAGQGEGGATVPASAKAPAKDPDKPAREGLAKESREPRIFVVPHAPDDPGPDPSDGENTLPKGKRPPYRALP